MAKGLTKGTTFEVKSDSRGCDYIEYQSSYQSAHNNKWYATDHILMRCPHCDHWYTPDSIVVNAKENVKGCMCVFCAEKAGIKFGRTSEHDYSQIIEEFGGWYI